ncbi:MAG: precorrin-8X methylmutase [Planctomycetota bacterium]|jgi:precorrin-8X/cobalt-precorrin-8 methylmutase|nr:precorrin-8X methylmutase [Planctomycetota bacterium]
MDTKQATILVGRGGRDARASARFLALAERLSSRLGAPVTPAFLASEPGVENTLRDLFQQGARSFLLMPFFLYEGVQVRVGLAGRVAAALESLPGATAETLPTLQDEPAVEDVLFDRLLDRLPAAPPPLSGQEIEKRSYEIIASALGELPPEGPDRDRERVVRRVVHAAGDLGFARSLLFRDGAVRAGVEALRCGKNLFADVGMLASGITRVDAARIATGIADPDVAAAAKRENATRAAAAVEKYADFWAGGILAVGNAPTALWRLLDLCRRGATPPSLTVGLPVGFVGAAEAKAALWESGLPAITNRGRRGGSPAAAAAVNAIAILAGESAGA